MKFGNTSNMAAHPNAGKASSYLPLAHQTSIYSMTFDELQSMGGLGKDFGSMNMEDLLRNFLNTEEADVFEGTGKAPAADLLRQGSLTLPHMISQRSVDQVWKDLLQERGDPKDGNGGRSSDIGQREPTLGEITLEDFLARAGLVKEDVQSVENPMNTGFYGGCTPTNGNSNELTFGFQQPAQSGINAQQMGNSAQLASAAGASSVVETENISFNPSATVNQNGIMEMAGLRGLTTTVAGGLPGNTLRPYARSKSSLDSSSLTSFPYALNEGGRGRKSASSIDKQVVERRQKRMIKNRESASRSRARKQAYTLELEAEVAKLKEDNKELQKRQAEVVETQKNQILESLEKPCGANGRCLRRTLTGPW